MKPLFFLPQSGMIP